MDIQVHNSTNKLNVSDVVFGAEYNEPLIHQVVSAYMAAGRSGTKAQLAKGEVRGGGKKPWKQKGTGRARAGSIRSPLWRGGGTTFAASPRDYSQKVNRKMYRGAIRSIVAELARQNHLVIVESITTAAAKTKDLVARLKQLGSDDILIVTGELDQNLFLSARNIPHVAVCDVEALNPVSLLRHEKVLMTADAVKKLEAWLQ
ncbi:50S ribosomal protein L4 [Solimonas terrae]|uniref:Large ribosomal subunit protein uL4 n=1 Tax=Solimonas terrae TaxID=1396819 RepID=A0A6M2BTY7_9GAMM|nr:50S ribosomal protein L4 [Solimonas terrae]NGY06076.1 50S ribosomal protein L4 [Solimonas terrae]